MTSRYLLAATTLVAASLLAVAVVEHRQAAKRIGNRAQALVSDFIEIARVRALLANSVDWRATRDRVLADLHYLGLLGGRNGRRTWLTCQKTHFTKEVVLG